MLRMKCDRCGTVVAMAPIECGLEEGIQMVRSRWKERILESCLETCRLRPVREVMKS